MHINEDRLATEIYSIRHSYQQNSFSLPAKNFLCYLMFVNWKIWYLQQWPFVYASNECCNAARSEQFYPVPREQLRTVWANKLADEANVLVLHNVIMSTEKYSLNTYQLQFVNSALLFFIIDTSCMIQGIVVVCASGNALVSINIVTPHLARLVLDGWPSAGRWTIWVCVIDIT